MAEKIQLKTPHAGEMLKTEYIKDIDINATKLARLIDIAPKRLYAIINGTQAVDSDIDARLCKYFKLSQGMFLRMQARHDEMQTRRNKSSYKGIARTGERLENQIPAE